MKIMMDANQGMDVVDALKLSEQAKGIGLQWFEEPVPHTDFAGYELLRQKCGIALAMGEREYDCEALKNLIARNALDLWQPDLIRLAAWRSGEILRLWLSLISFRCCRTITKITTCRFCAPSQGLTERSPLTGSTALSTIP